MQTIQTSIVPGPQVTALFTGSTLSFNLAQGATFADLAGRLEGLCLWQLGAPTAISLIFAPANILSAEG